MAPAPHRSSPAADLSLPPVDAVDSLALSALPTLLAHLAALQVRAATRLMDVAALDSTPGARDLQHDRRLYDVGEAAGFCHVSVTTIRRLEASGVLQSVRLGRRVLFERVQLEALVQRSPGSTGVALDRRQRSGQG